MKLKVIRYSSLFTLWLFTISGIIGIKNPEYSEWFLRNTPLNLSITFAIILINIHPRVRLKDLIAFAIPFFLGFITEALGVNYGLIFGNYSYGENLGFKFLNVPVIICINWVILTATTSDIAGQISKHWFLSAIIGSALMTSVDVLIEISAPRFDFWEFENGLVPLQNYIGWFFTAIFAHIGYQYFKVSTHKIISWHIVISIVVFFAFLS